MTRLRLNRLVRFRGPVGIARLTMVLLAVGLAWRIVRYAMCFPVWGDEAYVVVNLMSRDFARMMGQLEYNQFAPIGFMWGELVALKALGASAWALRLWPFLCGLAAMVLFWRLARRVMSRRAALLAVGIFAASFSLVRHGAEIKPYSVDLLVSTSLTCLGWSLLHGSGSPWRWGGLAALSGLAVWISYPSVFVAGGVVLVLTWDQIRRRRVRPLLAAVAVAAVLAASFAAVLHLSIEPMMRAGGSIRTPWASAFPPIRRPWLLPWWLVKVHTGNTLAYPVGGKNGASTLTFLLVVAGGVSIWRTGRRRLLALLLCPLALTLIAAAMRRYPHGRSIRISLHLAPAFCLLGGEGLAVLLKTCLRSSRRAAAGIRVAAVVLGLIALAGAARDVVRPYGTIEDQKTRHALRSLADRTNPAKDQWVIYNALGPAPHAQNLYFHGGMGARLRYYVARLGPRAVSWGPPADRVRPGAGKTWLIVYKGYSHPFPQDLFRVYIEALTARLGRPARRTFVIATGKRHERLEVYEFSLPTCPGRG